MIRDSLGPERDDRIDARRTPPRQIAGKSGNNGEKRRHCRERQRVARSDIEEEFRHEPRQREGARRAGGDPRDCQHHGLPDNHLNTSPRCAPSAMRIPISCVRWVTLYATTP